MRFNVLPELRQPLGTATSYDIAEQDSHLPDLDLEELKGVLTLLRTDEGLLASLDASALIHADCSRCLTPMTCQSRIAFEEEYVPLSDPATGARIHLGEDRECFRVGQDFVLDLSEGLRQYVLMATPTKPLCKPDCAGLCPNCGIDLNSGPCDCATTDDERWGALRAIQAGDREGS